MWFLLSAFAAPPDGVDPQDLTRWEAGSEALLAGPPGCWELSGKIALTGVGYTPASRWTRAGRVDHLFVGSFVGKLEDGVWSSFAYDLSPADKPGEPAKVDFPVYPGVGKIAEDVPQRTNPPEEGEGDDLEIDPDGEGAVNLLKKILDDLEPSTATAYADWREDDRAIHLFQDVPVSKAARAETVTVETMFPGGGPATALDATFPRRLKVGDSLIKVSIFDAQVHIRTQQAGDVVLPALDSLSFGVGALGFTLAYEQKLTFERAVRCSGG